MYDNVNSPDALKELALSALPELCEHIRNRIMNSVALSGGHFASSLGVVELSVALHYVFSTPTDSLVWDVGHQSYAHKILTGRGAELVSIRQLNGLSGFPKRSESSHDSFGTGHSSTSLSAILGMAIANMRKGLENTHVAVIGDGALTAGIAYEALQQMSAYSANVLIIVNDNGMSISENVGGLSNHLSSLSLDDGCTPSIQSIFSCLGLSYTGPVDGHDVQALVHILESLKKQSGPRILHVKTVKGKGHSAAEADPIAYHGISAQYVNSQTAKHAEKSVSFTQVFSHWLCRLAQSDERLVAITPAMREGSGLVEFSSQFPERFFDVGIAEQHALTFAAGMACSGDKPVVAIYSTFLQRAYDQLIHDVALQNLDVTIAVDRAGVVGEDGETHAGMFDLAFACAIPNMLVMTPSSGTELYSLLQTGYDHKGPALIRYPKEHTQCEQMSEHGQSLAPLPIGKAHVVKQGQRVALLVFGTLLSMVREYATNIDATLVDMRFAKPLDTGLITELASTHDIVITIEEGSQAGGIGEHVCAVVHALSATPRVVTIGMADTFVTHGKRSEVLAQYGFDAESLTARIDTCL